MVYKVLLIIVISSVFLDPVDMEETMRTKRVLYGLEAQDEHRDAYDSFRYYVFLSKTQAAWFWRKLKVSLAPNPDDLVCGGSLLTPSIVQTAAHCVAVLTEVEGNNLTYLRPKNVWECYLYSYVGSNLATTMVDWLKPKHYITYQASRRLGGSAQYVMYDFGLVLTKSSINERTPNAPISYVPAYRGASIHEFYYAAISKEYTCLHIGHGYWDIPYYTNAGYDEDDDMPVISTHLSDPVRWGWRTLMNYIDCEYVTYDPLERKEFYFNYTRDATWVCSQPFRHYPRGNEFFYHTGEGDSGGPVTCNNVHFAVVSGGATAHADDIITYYSPIIHTLFENAAEFRDDFISFCNGITADRPIPNSVYPDLTVTPPPERPLSMSPKIFFHCLLQLFTTVFIVLI